MIRALFTEEPHPDYAHMESVVRWEEPLRSGVMATCSADVAREAAVAVLRGEAAPVTWPWQREGNAHGPVAGTLSWE